MRCRDKKGCRKCVLSACLEPDTAAALWPSVLLLTADAEAGTFLCLFYQIRKSSHKETRSGQSVYRMELDISEEFISAPVAVAEQCWEEVSWLTTALPLGHCGHQGTRRNQMCAPVWGVGLGGGWWLSDRWVAVGLRTARPGGSRADSGAASPSAVSRLLALSGPSPVIQTHLFNRISKSCCSSKLLLSKILNSFKRNKQAKVFFHNRFEKNASRGHLV